MSFQEKSVQDYVEAHTTQEDELLHQLNRETYLHVLNPGMISGSYQGKLLEFISRMIQPHRILEIGTFTGYSAICLGRGLTENGLLYTIDINDELTDRAKKYVIESGLENKVRFLIGQAMDIIPAIDETFDLVFIDADKINYAHYFDLTINKVRKGGFIIVDNVLWKGKVSDPSVLDKKTKAMAAFNQMVQESYRVENIMLPIRDGLTLIRKIQ